MINKTISTIMIIMGISFIVICAIALIMYSTFYNKRIKKLEKKLPKKGEKCYGYVYYVEGGDNGSKTFYVATYLESKNIIKLLKYQTFTNRKLRVNWILNGYYYNNKVVLDKKNIAIKDLPQNVINAFELNNEETI